MLNCQGSGAEHPCSIGWSHKNLWYRLICLRCTRSPHIHIRCICLQSMRCPHLCSSSPLRAGRAPPQKMSAHVGKEFGTGDSGLLFAHLLPGQGVLHLSRSLASPMTCRFDKRVSAEESRVGDPTPPGLLLFWGGETLRHAQNILY